MIQSKEVKTLLKAAHHDLNIEIQVIRTLGDEFLNKSFQEIGGKGLFTSELEKGLIAHEIDLAVHSLKDLPSQLDKGLQYIGSFKREDARDAFISKRWKSLQDVPYGGIIATGSVRRKAQLLAVRSDLKITNLRGNVDTRLKKLEKNNWDGIIVAAAAMHRLKQHDLVTEYFDPHFHVPSAGQGALGLEIAEGRSDIEDIIKSIIDEQTTLCCHSERKCLQILGGGCSVPVGCYAELINKKIFITGFISDEDGSNKILKTIEGLRENAMSLAEKLSYNLLNLQKASSS